MRRHVLAFSLVGLTFFALAHDASADCWQKFRSTAVRSCRSVRLYPAVPASVPWASVAW